MRFDHAHDGSQRKNKKCKNGNQLHRHYSKYENALGASAKRALLGCFGEQGIRRVKLEPAARSPAAQP
jgi:hypothetical protein